MNLNILIEVSNKERSNIAKAMYEKERSLKCLKKSWKSLTGSEKAIYEIHVDVMINKLNNMIK